MNQRERWLDISKGIGIILVVMGHSGHPISHYLFWFHMPLFFVISGYLHKPLNSISAFPRFIQKKFKQLIVPYICFGAFINIFYLFAEQDINSMLFNFLKIIYGGQVLTGYFGVFWFVTCLFLTQILFSLLLVVSNNNKIKLSFFIIFSYVIAHFYITIPELIVKNMIWNADVVLIAIVFYGLGYIFKNQINIVIKNKVTIYLALFLALFFILLDRTNKINFIMDLKAQIFTPYFLDLIIPVIFIILILAISYKIQNLKVATIFEKLGVSSLTIMYLHMPFNYILLYKTFGQYNLLAYTLIGVILPYLLYLFILNKYDFAKRYFLGINTK